MSFTGADGALTAAFAPAAAQNKAGGMQVVATGSLTGGAFGLFGVIFPPAP